MLYPLLWCGRVCTRARGRVRVANDTATIGYRVYAFYIYHGIRSQSPSLALLRLRRRCAPRSLPLEAINYTSMGGVFAHGQRSANPRVVSKVSFSGPEAARTYSDCPTFLASRTAF